MSTKLRYVLLDPTKNYTILVRTPVPVSQQPVAAARLMQAEPLAEQVGFLAGGDGRHICFRMAGGEFCGNAAMSAAVLRAADAQETDANFTVEFQQAGTCVTVSVQSNADGSYTGTVLMPQPQSVAYRALPGGKRLPVVTFAGIAHVVVQSPMEKAQAEKLAPIWCEALQTQAVGIMRYDCETDRLTPLVYVPSADTLYWENSCASGTAAVGCFLAQQTDKPFEKSIKQPGGVLRIRSDGKGGLCLTGTVRIAHEREMVF